MNQSLNYEFFWVNIFAKISFRIRHDEKENINRNFTQGTLSLILKSSQNFSDKCFQNLRISSLVLPFLVMLKFIEHLNLMDPLLYLTHSTYDFNKFVLIIESMLIKIC